MDGELDTGFTLTVNRVGMSYTTIYPAPTFPTMTDSDTYRNAPYYKPGTPP